ncbi:MAG TPA: heme-binding protein [Vicinamibacteria bacterium]|nr:heme-binding protein [Vicinamibacteria bacterium]
MRIRIGMLLGLLTAAVTASGQVVSTKNLGIAGARAVADAAENTARKLGAPGAAIAVVDQGGNLLYLVRLDGTFAAGSRISEGKARTAALFKRPTKVFEDIVNQGRTTMVALDDFTPLQGGVPVTVDGEVIGAIGVSGAASAAQDEEIAVAGAAALSDGMGRMSSDEIFYLESDKVRAAFQKGAPLIELSDYKVHASHRDKGGESEIHQKETDIIYVLDGSATFVTGGKVVDGRTTAPGEIRGAGIEGGTTRRLTKGDVIIVPQGTPHWFKEVDGVVDYYVVKVLS